MSRHRIPIDVKELDVRRPLDSFPSIKLKLSFVIAAAVAGTIFVFWLGIKAGHVAVRERDPRRAASRW